MGFHLLNLDKLLGNWKLAIKLFVSFCRTSYHLLVSYARQLGSLYTFHLAHDLLIFVFDVLSSLMKVIWLKCKCLWKLCFQMFGFRHFCKNRRKLWTSQVLKFVHHSLHQICQIQCGEGNFGLEITEKFNLHND